MKWQISQRNTIRLLMNWIFPAERGILSRERKQCSSFRILGLALERHQLIKISSPFLMFLKASIWNWPIGFLTVKVDVIRMIYFSINQAKIWRHFVRGFPRILLLECVENCSCWVHDFVQKLGLKSPPILVNCFLLFLFI